MTSKLQQVNEKIRALKMLIEYKKDPMYNKRKLYLESGEINFDKQKLIDLEREKSTLIEKELLNG